MNKKTSNITNIAIIGVFTAIVSIISALPIGFNILGVPATLQTLAMAFIGYTLGHKKGSLVVFIYILLGAIGIPVFNGFKGGFVVILGVTGGFIFGFLILAFFCGLSMKFKNIFIRIAFGIIGLAICHIVGSIQAGIYLGMSPINAAALVSLPYLPKDILSVILGYFIALAVRKSFVSAKIYNVIFPDKENKTI